MSDHLDPIPWFDVLLILALIGLNGVLAMSELDRSSSQTNGAVIFDSQRIGRDITAAIGSGDRSAIVLGTISPITSET